MYESAPYHSVPITLAFVATRQKAYRKLHCIECGMPFLELDGKVAYVSDSGSNAAGTTQFQPDVWGSIAGVQCPRRTCRQHFRMQF